MLLTLVVQKWGTEEVAAWLDLLNLGEYKEIFIRHDIRGAELLHLERRDLKVFPLCYSSALENFLAKQNPSSRASLLCAFCLACVVQTCRDLTFTVLESVILVCFLKRECRHSFPVKITLQYSMHLVILLCFHWRDCSCAGISKRTMSSSVHVTCQHGRSLLLEKTKQI